MGYDQAACGSEASVKDRYGHLCAATVDCVFCVEIEIYDMISQLFHQLLALAGNAVRVWRTQVCRYHTEDIVDGHFVVYDLVLSLLGVYFVEIFVGPGMRSDLMASAIYAFECLWPRCCLIVNHTTTPTVAIDKKRGLRIVLLKQVKNRKRVRRLWAVVKCERNGSRDLYPYQSSKLLVAI
jgi:hypothetical protein